MPEIKNSLDSDLLALKHLDDVKKIGSNSELNIEQVRAVNLINGLGVVFGSAFIKMHVRDFLILQKSKNRQSLKEWLEGMKSKREKAIEAQSSFNLFGSAPPK